MAWNPNEPGNYAWLTKQASEHGGANQYIASIEENAAAKQHEKDMKQLLCVYVPTLLALGATTCAAAKAGYEKIKKRIIEHREEKEREAEEAKKIIRKACKQSKNQEISEEET